MYAYFKSCDTEIESTPANNNRKKKLRELENRCRQDTSLPFFLKENIT